MIRETFQKKSFDGRKIFFRNWKIEDATSVIALVHGLGEHSGRYEEFGEYFCKNKISVVSMDLFGHGNTEGKKGHTAKMNDYLWQIDLLISTTKELYPGLPITLYGHSMGGCFVINALYKKNLDIKAIIASAPALRPGFKVPTIKLWLGKFSRAIFPSLTLPNGLDVNNLSNDISVIENYKKDPLVHDDISSEVGIGLLEWGEWILENAKKPPHPLLIMHGSADKLTSFKTSKDFSKKMKGKIDFKEWEGMKHEIHNEIEKKKVLDFALHWIKDKV